MINCSVLKTSFSFKYIEIEADVTQYQYNDHYEAMCTRIMAITNEKLDTPQPFFFHSLLETE
jgi:hypothetical protein